MKNSQRGAHTIERIIEVIVACILMFIAYTTKMQQDMKLIFLAATGLNVLYSLVKLIWTIFKDRKDQGTK